MLRINAHLRQPDKVSSGRLQMERTVHRLKATDLFQLQPLVHHTKVTYDKNLASESENEYLDVPVTTWDPIMTHQTVRYKQ